METESNGPLEADRSQPCRLGPVAAGCLAVILATTPVQAQEVDISAASQHPAVRAAMSACMADHSRLCSFVMPGGGRIVRCLAGQADKLSAGCRAAMQHARDALVADSLAAPAAQAPH